MDTEFYLVQEVKHINRKYKDSTQMSFYNLFIFLTCINIYFLNLCYIIKDVLLFEDSPHWKDLFFGTRKRSSHTTLLSVQKKKIQDFDLQ